MHVVRRQDGHLRRYDLDAEPRVRGSAWIRICYFIRGLGRFDWVLKEMTGCLWVELGEADVIDGRVRA